MKQDRKRIEILVRRALELFSAGLSIAGCGPGDLARDACELHFECEPEQEEFEDMDECVKELKKQLRQAHKSECGEAQRALIECSVEHGSASCQDHTGSVCDSPFVCTAPSIDEWPCADEEWDVYGVCD